MPAARPTGPAQCLAVAREREEAASSQETATAAGFQPQDLHSARQPGGPLHAAGLRAGLAHPSQHRLARRWQGAGLLDATPSRMRNAARATETLAWSMDAWGQR
jgi:hypothetical protein